MKIKIKEIRIRIVLFLLLVVLSHQIVPFLMQKNQDKKVIGYSVLNVMSIIDVLIQVVNIIQIKEQQLINAFTMKIIKNKNKIQTIPHKI